MVRSFPPLPEHEGLATRRQLSEAHWTRHQIENLALTRGQRLHRAIYCGHRGRLSEDEQLLAGLLWAGDGAALTGAHALASYGLDVGEIHGIPTFIVPRTRRSRSTPGFQTRRSVRQPRTRLLNGIQVVTIERALADAGRLRQLAGAVQRAAVIAALQRRLTTPDRLLAELNQGRPNRVRWIRQGRDDYCNGAWSMAEVALRDVLSARPSHEVLYNPQISDTDGRIIGVPDAYLPKSGVAIQVHSRQYHDGADGLTERWEQTVEADSAYPPHGIVLVGVAPTTLRDHPDRFLDRLDRVIAAQVGRSCPRIRIAEAMSHAVTRTVTERQVSASQKRQGD